MADLHNSDISAQRPQQGVMGISGLLRISIKVTHPMKFKLHIGHTENAQIWFQRLKETTWSQINTFFTTESTHETAECAFSSECCSGVRSQSKQCWLCINMNEVCCQRRCHVVVTFSSWGWSFLANTDTVWVQCTFPNENFLIKCASFPNPLPHFLWTWQPPRGISGPPPLWLPQWPGDLSQTGPCGCPLQAHTPHA